MSWFGPDSNCNCCQCCTLGAILGTDPANPDSLCSLYMDVDNTSCNIDLDANNFVYTLVRDPGGANEVVYEGKASDLAAVGYADGPDLFQLNIYQTAAGPACNDGAGGPLYPSSAAVTAVHTIGAGCVCPYVCDPPKITRSFAQATVSNFTDSTTVIPIQGNIGFGFDPTFEEQGQWTIQHTGFTALNHTIQATMTNVTDFDCTNNPGLDCPNVYMDPVMQFLGTVSITIQYTDNAGSVNWPPCGDSGAGSVSFEVWSILGSFSVDATGTPSLDTVTNDACGVPSPATDSFALHFRCSAVVNADDTADGGCPGTSANTGTNVSRAIGFDYAVNDSFSVTSAAVRLTDAEITDSIVGSSDGALSNSCHNIWSAGTGLLAQQPLSTHKSGIDTPSLTYRTGFNFGQGNALLEIYPHHFLPSCPNGLFVSPNCNDASHQQVWKDQESPVQWDGTLLGGFDANYISGPTLQWTFL